MSPRTKRGAGRGRRVLGWGVALFLGVQVTVSALLDYRWPEIRFPFLAHQTTRLDAFETPPSVVCLGSSRFGCFFDEDVITNVVRQITGDPAAQFYNASIPGGDPIVSEQVLSRLLERGARPRYALIEMCPEVVHHRSEWIRLHVGRQLRWDDVPTYLPEVTMTGNLLRWAGTRFAPTWTFRDQIRQKIAREATAWADPPAAVGVDPGLPWWPRAVGKMPVDPSVDWSKLIADSLNTKPDTKYTTDVGVEFVARGLRRYRPGGTSAAALENMLRLCREYGVEPILLDVPLPTSHRAMYTAEIEAAYQDYVKTLTEQYRCRFVDYRTRVPDCFFIDHHHASTVGKLLFSRIVGVELLAPLWNGTKG